MSDRIGLFTGSFDPITKGHVDLIERASRLFDKLYVGIFYNREKSGFFRIEARERMVKEALQHLDNVEVITSQNELAVTVASRIGAKTFVRGLRNNQDLDYETSMNFFNQKLDSELETIFLLSKPAYQYISSSRIRELIAFKQSITPYVPQSVVREIERELYEKD